MELPSWLDAPKIMGLAVLVLLITQYFKEQIPAKAVRYFAMGLGILLAIVCECYMEAKFSWSSATFWAKAILNGAVAAVAADFGYSFLSRKGGLPFTIPSKKEGDFK